MRAGARSSRSAEPRRFRYGRFDTHPLGLADLLRIADELAQRALALAGRRWVAGRLCAALRGSAPAGRRDRVRGRGADGGRPGDRSPWQGSAAQHVPHDRRAARSSSCASCAADRRSESKSPGIRISSGATQGPQARGADGIRPTEQKVKEALFSIWGERLAEATMLDLFGGSGAVAIEAISRGALEVTVVESNRSVLEALKRNAAILPAGSFHLLARPVETGSDGARRGRRRPVRHRLRRSALFVGAGRRVSRRLLGALLRSGGVLTIEHSSRVALPASRPATWCGRTRGATASRH